MITVVRERGKNVKGTHHVYTQAEADDLGLCYVYWKHARKGDWALSDDGYVIECMKTSEYYDSRRSKISRFDVSTIFYAFSVSRGSCWQKTLQISRALRGMSSLVGKSWQENFVSSRKGRQWIKFVAVMILNRNIDYEAFGKMLDFDPDRYRDSTLVMVKRYLRDPAIENAIMIQMSEYLSDKGITYDYVMDKYKSVLEDSIKEKKFNDAIKILEKFERWTGLQSKIDGDKVEHSRGEDMVGVRIEAMLKERQNPKSLPGGKQGHKVPASWNNQVFDEDGNRLEYIEVPETQESDD